MYQDANTFNETLTIFAQGFMAQRADSLIGQLLELVDADNQVYAFGSCYLFG